VGGVGQPSLERGHYAKEKNLYSKFDFDVMAEEIAQTQGMPQRAIRGDREVAKLREQRAAVKQAMQKAAVIKEAADAVPKLGQKEEKGSVLDEMRKGA